MEGDQVIVLPTSSNVCAKMLKLLLDWGLEELIPEFTAKEINIEVMQNLTCDDINALISPERFGIRVLFRTKLFKWRFENGLIPVMEKFNNSSSPSKPDGEKDDNTIEVSELIELDFERLFPCKNNLLFLKWDQFEGKILPLYHKQIKDIRNKHLLSCLCEKGVQENSKHFLLIALLQAVVKPQLIKIKTSQGYKQWKPSISDGQSAFAIHLKDANFIESTINIRKEQFLAKNLTLQPFIIVIGETINDLQDFFIYFNDVIYSTESFLKALSVVFQIYHIFNLKYDQQCRQVWSFIEEYFYEFSTGPISTSTRVLLSSLK